MGISLGDLEKGLGTEITKSVNIIDATDSDRYKYTIGNNVPITREFIISKIPEERIMEHYLGITPRKGLFKSPLRSDNQPTCAFTRDRAGRLIFKDFSGAFYGDFTEIVKRKFNVSYKEALAIIANDFGLAPNCGLIKNKPCIKYTETEFKASEGCEIAVELKDFTQEELTWWSKFGIGKTTLNKFFVFSCQKIYLNDHVFSWATPTTFNFGYFYPQSNKEKQYWRIYYPLNRKNRWISNWKKTMIQGVHMLPKDGGDLLVITKSLKDCMSLYECGITAIAPNSENLFLTDAQWDKLVIKFRRIIILYDNDQVGVESVNKFRKLHKKLIPVFIKRSISKDFSDLCKVKGTSKMLEAGEELLSIGKDTSNSKLNYFYRF